MTKKYRLRFANYPQVWVGLTDYFADNGVCKVVKTPNYSTAKIYENKEQMYKDIDKYELEVIVETILVGKKKSLNSSVPGTARKTSSKKDNRIISSNHIKQKKGV